MHCLANQKSVKKVVTPLKQFVQSYCRSPASMLFHWLVVSHGRWNQRQCDNLTQHFVVITVKCRERQNNYLSVSRIFEFFFPHFPYVFFNRKCAHSLSRFSRTHGNPLISKGSWSSPDVLEQLSLVTSHELDLLFKLIKKQLLLKLELFGDFVSHYSDKTWISFGSVSETLSF